MHVTIYIETTLHGPAKRSGAGMWLIEYINRKNEPVTRQGTLYRGVCTENSLSLELLYIAFSRLTKICSVRVNTQCEHLLNSCSNHRPAQWEKNGWHKANGTPVKNAELWEQAYILMKKHQVTFENGENPYRMVMQKQMIQEMERRKQSIQ